MAQQNINIGSSANKGDGDPIRTAFSKVNANFTELYGKVIVLEGGGVAIQRDTQGSIFGDDSTLLVDAVNSLIPSSVLSGNLPALDGSALTGVVTGSNTGVINFNSATLNFVSTTFNGLDFDDLGTTPTTLAGYGITDAATSAQGVLAASALQAETITLTTLKTEVAAATDFADFKTRIAAL